MLYLIFYFAYFLLFFVANTVVAQTLCSNPKCHGGRIYCDDCDYSGELNGKKCPKCNGEGIYPCPNCNGTGSVGNSNVSASNSDNVNNSNNSSKPHQFKCPECNGEKFVPAPCSNPKCNHGTIYCAECNQTGKISHDCSKCGGSGTINTSARKIDCPVCDGKKYVIEEVQERCKNCREGKRPTAQPSKTVHTRDGKTVTRPGKTVYIDCTKCNGNGYIPKKVQQPCSYCRKGGYIIKKGSFTEECDSCKGKGQISEKCSKCNGKGSFPCPNCKGYGNVREKCSRCRGEGVIYTE